MERRETLRVIDGSGLPVTGAARAAGISRSTYYRWRNGGWRRSGRRSSWNALSEEERAHILEVSDSHPEWSPREIAWWITDSGRFSVSESTVYRLMKRAGKIPVRPEEPQRAGKEYVEKPESVHEQWQVDFTDFFLPSWGWYHDGGVLDDRSRFLLYHELRPQQRAADAVEVLSGAVDFAIGTHGYAASRLVSDNGKCFLARDTQTYLGMANIRPIRARAHHPQTLGKLERLHRTMKEVVNLHVYETPEDLSRAIDEFYHYYNYVRVHEALGNLRPADVYYGRAEEVLARRRATRARTMEERRQRYHARKREQTRLTSQGTGGRLESGRSRKEESHSKGHKVSHYR
jgi:transposase InsO family protein